MKASVRLAVVVALGVAVAAIVVAKNGGSPTAPGAGVTAATMPAGPSTTRAAVAAAVPRLICVGAGKCVPCRMMEPIREALRTEYEGRLAVEYHDITKEADAAERYGIHVIPTSILQDATGKEVGRLEGYVEKQVILERFRQAGVAL